VVSSAPTKEIGQANLGFTLPGWKSFASATDEREYAPKLKWPGSIDIFERMETDAQLAGLLLGLTLGIRRYRWFIDPNGARDEIAEKAALNFNLPLKGEEAPPSAGRDRRRFSHDRHLAHTLRAPAVYGHYFMEQVAEYVDGEFKLRKLAPRPPYTIAKGGGIQVATDGGLQAIKQGFGFVQKEIPVDRLVAYVWEQEGANWFGRSMLRPCYKNWLLKDDLLRHDAMKHARNSMGIPWFETGPELTQDQVDALAEKAEELRAGESSGGAGPGKLQVKGVEGSLSDILASIRYHDQQMSMAMVELFADLGRNSETGSRSLGEVTYNHFAFAQDAIAAWHAGITTEHALWDWVDWNYSGDDGAPRVGYERVEEREASISDLSTLIEKEVVVVDEALREAVRQHYNFPPPSDPDPGPPAEPEPSPPVEPEIPVQARAGERRRRTVAAATSLPLPDRELRRQPYEQEVQAKVDYELMDAQVQGQIDALVATVKGLQAGQVTELATAIEAADGDLTVLAGVEATPVFSGALEDAMLSMAAQGVEQAIGEAERQGLTLPVPDLDTSSLTARAEAVDTLLTRSLSEAAGRKAVGLTAESGALAPAEVAAQVSDHLSGLSDDYLRQQLSGATVQAMNTGRKAVFAENPPKYLYASELLDEAACEECVAIDGTEYESLEEAEQDYPCGGFKDCLGGPRCRGTLVAIYSEAEPSQ
jgi:hypothetical protein